MYDPAMRMPLGLPPPDGRPFDAVGFGLNMTDLLVVLERFPEPELQAAGPAARVLAGRAGGKRHGGVRAARLARPVCRLLR